MSLLREVLCVPAVNRLARQVGRVVLPGRTYQKFDRRLPLVEPFEVTLPNGKIVRWMPQGDILSKPLRFDGWDGYERPSVRLFFELARHARVVLDVGAYLGYFALLGAAAGEGSRAFAFEALPALADKCRALAALNPSLNVQVISAAVGRAGGTINLYVGDGAASDTSTDPAFRPDRKPISVDAVTIDGFVARQALAEVDLLKIDTETTEPDVLAGMAETVRRSRPTMLVEVLNVARVAELEAFLRDNDYACAWVHADGILARAHVEPDMTCTHSNYLFYPRRADNAVAAAAEAIVRA